MGDWLVAQGKKLALSICGTVAVLVWWTITGTGGVDYEELDRWPSVVYGGGQHVLRMEVELSQPGRLHATFDRWDDATEDWVGGLDYDQPLAAGEHTFTVDTGPGATAYLQVQIPEPTVGAKLKWTLYLGDEELHTEVEELTRPLEDGYAFFVNFDFEGEIDQYAQWLAERDG